jgi:hypothetical protein
MSDAVVTGRKDLFAGWTPSKDLKPEEVVRAIELQEQVAERLRGIPVETAKSLAHVANAGLDKLEAVASKFREQPTHVAAPAPAAAAEPKIEVVAPTTKIETRPPQQTSSAFKPDRLRHLVKGDKGPMIDIRAHEREAEERILALISNPKTP